MTQQQEAGSATPDDDVAALVEERLLMALHEIRQPLAAVLALAEAAGGGDVPDAARRYLDQIVEQVQEVTGVAGSILGARRAAPVPSEPSLLAVDELVGSVCRAVGVTWKGTLYRQGDTGALVDGLHRVQMRRCLVNVVENAVRAAGPHGRIAVTVREEPRWIRILVEDDGPGFGHLPTRTGMGLPLTRQCLRAIGGSLSIGVRSSLGGATVALSFPSASRSRAALVEGAVSAG